MKRTNHVTYFFEPLFKQRQIANHLLHTNDTT